MRQPDQGSSRSTLAHGDVSVLVQEVIWFVSRKGSISLVDPAENIPAQRDESDATGPTMIPPLAVFQNDNS